jgi:G-protein alpha subunit
LFVASIASYDQVLQEDNTCNRMVDSLVLFEEIANNPLLMEPNIILFLNKKDLFAEKARVLSVKNFFPDYDGKPPIFDKGKPLSASHAALFFEKKFRQQIKGTKSIATHLTCITDTNAMRKIVNAIT